MQPISRPLRSQPGAPCQINSLSEVINLLYFRS